MTDEYLAGFFDADGCVQVIRKGRVLMTRLKVAQVVREPLDAFRDRFGGSVLGPYRATNTDNDRPHYLWLVDGRPAVAALEVMQPFLIVKQDRAALILETKAFLDDLRTLSPPDRVCNDRVRLHAKTRLAVLNHRGR